MFVLWGVFMFFRKHKKLIIFLCILLVVALSGLIGYLVAESEPRVVAQVEEEDPAVQAGADNDRISIDTVITWDYEYEMCKHHITTDTEPDTNMIGLSFTQLKSMYPDLSIVSFSADEVVLKKRLECYCPEHFVLKRNADKLAVYRTAAGTDKQDMVVDIDIAFDGLTKEQKESLEEGRVFGDFDDLQIYLEKISR
jgi:hypothetical protein